MFVNVHDEMRINKEEILGPVASLMAFDDIGEVTRRANLTSFGLTGGVWTRDIGTAHQMARSIRTGVVWVNTYGNFDAAMPFGGTGMSGWGKELGMHSLDEYLNTARPCGFAQTLEEQSRRALLPEASARGRQRHMVLEHRGPGAHRHATGRRLRALGTWSPGVDEVVRACARLRDTCHEAGVSVIYTKVEYLADGSNTPQAIATEVAKPTRVPRRGLRGGRDHPRIWPHSRAWSRRRTLSAHSRSQSCPPPSMSSR